MNSRHGSCFEIRRTISNVRLLQRILSLNSFRFGYSRGTSSQLKLLAAAIPKWAHIKCNSVKEGICTISNSRDDEQRQVEHVSFLRFGNVTASIEFHNDIKVQRNSLSFSSPLQGINSEGVMTEEFQKLRSVNWPPRVERTASR